MINNQNKSKVYLVIIGILLIANIAMLTFFLQKKGPDKQSSRPDRKAVITNFLQKEIGFNQQQLSEYDTLSRQHREKIGGLFEKNRTNKTEQFKQLVAGNFSDSVITVIADKSAAAQKIIEVQMFNHIRGIRQLCTPDQMSRFDTSFAKVFNRRGNDGRKKTDKK